MSRQEITNQSVHRLLAAQTPFGRTRLHARTAWKRLCWRGIIHATQAIKRALDIIGSLVALILLAPVFVLIAVIIRLDGGPAFFRQIRIGRNGREFRMLKFRTMCLDAEAQLTSLLASNEKSSGVTFKMKNDPRITPVGRVLRKSSLDELPQFWNVLLGDMSLVGPRPPVGREVALYSQSDRRRLVVKPGITGLWQVGERRGGLFEIGDRNAIDFPEQVDLDVRYIEHQSIGKDLWLLAKTVPAMVFGKGM